jgi:hypothetical protein
MTKRWGRLSITFKVTYVDYLLSRYRGAPYSVFKSLVLTYCKSSNL